MEGDNWNPTICSGIVRQITSCTLIKQTTAVGKDLVASLARDDTTRWVHQWLRPEVYPTISVLLKNRSVIRSGTIVRIRRLGMTSYPCFCLTWLEFSIRCRKCPYTIFMTTAGKLLRKIYNYFPEGPRIRVSTLRQAWRVKKALRELKPSMNPFILWV